MFFCKQFRQFVFVSVAIIATSFSANAEVFFRENKGQVKDQNWQPRPDILYSYDEGALHVHLKKDGLHYQLQRVLSWKQDDEQGSKRKLVDSLGIYRIDVQWLNTNKNVQIEKGNELTGYENFYNVPDGVEPALFVKRYEKIVYKNIYNDIDLHFFEGKHGGLEYDYIVQPGANYQTIQWAVNGASLRVNDKKELVLKTPYGEIVEGALLVLQGDKKIDAEWILKGNVVSVHIMGAYDKTKPLRIDPPVRLWGTYYAGTGLDALLSCVEDAAGNVYAAGDASANNMATSGAHQTVFAAGSADGLLAKFNTNGQRLWATYYGGNFADRGKACGVDASGNVYLMGVTQSDNGIASAGAYQATRGGGSDVFIAKFNSTGVRQWGTYFGGTSGDDGKSAVVDAAGNVYVCGNASYTSAVLASAGTHQTNFAGGTGQDCFLAKFNTSGQRVWGTYYGGSADDRPGGCSVDATGNVYLCGTTSSAAAIATAGAHQTVLNNQGDAFLVKFNGTNGTRLWGTYYGGSNYEYGVGCGADAAGNVYLLGRTNSTSLIATVGTHQSNFAGDYDAFIIKLNGTNGTRLWGTYYGGTGNEEPGFLHTNSAGDILITGETLSATLIATATAHQTTNAGGSDGFLALFNTNGQRTWGTYYGGANFEEGRSCHIGASGFYYMCGLADSPTGIATAGTYQSTGGGSGFLAKFEACLPPAAPTATGTTICGGQTATLTATAPSGVTFNWFAASTGGTALGTGATFTTPTLNTTTTYYVEAVATGCPPSTRTPVTVTVTPAPAAPIANTLTPGVCRDSVATFQVTSAGTTFNWYATATSITILGTGTTFTSPPLTANASYFVERVENGCPSPRTQVFVQVITAPDPTPANTQICAGTTATLSSNLTTGTVNWYNAPNATTPIFTGATFSTPTLNSNTTYYVQNFVSGCPSARVPVMVTVVTPPAAPTVSGTTICAGQTATLNATAPSGLPFAWFTQAMGGAAVFTGNPFITPALNNNTTYYVEAQAGTCNSTRTAVTVTVNPSPAAPIANTLTPGVCRDSTATFQVTSTGSTFNWYATATSTIVLGTGTTFTSPPLTANASYFVERVENGCPSPRTQVFVQVITAPDPTPASTQICAGTSATLNSNLSSGTVNWYNAPSATTAIFTGLTFTTPVLNANTTYYVQNFVNGCPSARVPVTVTVVTPPAAPTVNGDTICAGQTATLNATAPSGVTFAWFTAATGGTAVFTGNPFTTPTLNNNTTYYVEAQLGSCNSPTRNSVLVNVNPTPAAPTVAGITICSGETTILNATAPANVTFNWYNTATGGTSLLNGSSFTTPALTANTTYYVDATSGNCTSTRTAVIVTVNQPPVQPVVAAVSICEGETAILNATAPVGATFNWYDAPNAGNLLQTGNSFTTPVLNTNTTYYVEAFNGCVSARTAVLVTVNTPPIPPTAAGVTICSGQTASLTATAPAGVTFLWFSTPSGGSILSSGNIFTTQPLNNTTTFYVAAEAAGCLPSARTPVTVNVEPTPTEPVVNNTTICSGETATLTATAPTGVSFEWFADSVGGTVIENNASFTTTALTATTTYYVAAVLGNCASARVTVEVTVNQPPLLPNATNAAICEGETATLTATSSAGATINWYNDNSSSNLLFSGNDFTTPALTTNTSYFVQAEAVGCPPTNSVEVVVTVLPAPAAPLANDITICSGNTATLTATAADSAATIQWHDDISQGIVLGSGSIFTTAELLTTTTYYVSAQLGNCPSSQRTPVVVNVLPTPVAAFSSEPELTRTVMVSQANFTFSNNTTNGSRYVWSFGDGDSLETFNTQEVSHKYQQPGSYTVTLCAFTADGCSNCITYENITVVEDYAIYIPNAFTPNGDGNNDVFQYHLIGVKQAYIFIFNRWGEKVFETDSPTEYWDGTYKGKLMNPDVYVYHIKLVSYDNKQAEFKGSVTIIR